MKTILLSAVIAMLGTTSMAQSLTQLSCVAQASSFAGASGRIMDNPYPFPNIQLHYDEVGLIGAFHIMGCDNNVDYSATDTRLSVICEGSSVRSQIYISRLSGEFTYLGTDAAKGISYYANGYCTRYTDQKF